MGRVSARTHDQGLAGGGWAPRFPKGSGAQQLMLRAKRSQVACYVRPDARAGDLECPASARVLRARPRRKVCPMRLFPARRVNLRAAAAAMPAALAVRPADAMERAQAAAADILEAVERGREAIDRGRDAAAEIVEAARAAMPIEAMR